MLARLKSSPAPNFEKLLAVPAKPAAIGEAEQALQEASSARQAGQSRHVEAGQRLASQRLGEPPKITQHDVDAIGAELEPLFAAEAEAKARRDQAVAAYEATLAPALAEPLRQYRDAIAAALDNLDALFAEGLRFKAKATLAGVDLKRISHLPGCIPPLMQHLEMVRKVFNHANRT
ncbi:hypothetical protein X747_24820 [Mesorhizobium sp. LNJC384A00]|uniref:hypothetical protein n=1 Tax=Mesorhizobium sp. LNJC384A00 TaxID=1287268 RepID=UPI0003CF2AC3|nr:hypothetical protein [Mesorhizobium sp. LNJC384A00]ESY37891.1 hypothetical protein X747_24820 [Mesorhizobium sp. LNJC384A00]